MANITGATLENNTVYEWILSTFDAVARHTSLQSLEPHLLKLLHPGDEVLDLCCGSGPMSFWFEDQGARVTGMDFAPYMIGLATQEAARRKSTVKFIQADILLDDLGQGRYELATCFGNSISDFPLSDFAKLGKKVTEALKPGGRFALDYHDGSCRYLQGTAPRQGVYQETPERITYRFKEYLPEAGAIVNIIRNETRGTEYQRKSYIYTVPVVQQILGNVLEPEQHILAGENHYLDIFAKPA